jgi:hypothetical protein
VRAALIGLVLALPLAAQTKLTAKSFLPPDYTNVVSVDLAAMRAIGVLDDIEASKLKAHLRMLDLGTGWPLARLDHLTLASVIGASAGGQSPNDGACKRVCVLEGSAPLTIAPVIQVTGNREIVAGHEVVAPSSDSETVYVNPQPRMQVFGSRDLVVPVLEGKPWNGRPAADVMSLLSGSGDNLAFVVCDLRGASYRRGFILGVLGAKWADDSPRVMSARVFTIGKQDEVHLLIEVVIRHDQAGGGLRASEAAVRAWLARAAVDPGFTAMKSLWTKVELKQQVGDLVVSLDFGRPRDAAGALTELLLPMVAVVGEAEGAKHVEIVERRAAGPAPAPKPNPKEGGH